MMREVHINFGEIAAVMEEQGWLNEYYLDFPSGDLVIIPSELRDLDTFDAEITFGLPG